MLYECAECEYQVSYWTGRCRSCGEWNTVRALDKTEGVEEMEIEETLPIPRALTEIEGEGEARFLTRVEGLDWVLGGGCVPGSVIAIGGEPGIGKSTVVMQALSEIGDEVLYVSGEETLFQTKMRAERLGCATPNVMAISESVIESIIEVSREMEPTILAVDSIQTVKSRENDSAPGSVAQVRECIGQLVRHAKTSDTTIFVVGHVTKDGDLAGPKTMEHFVDVVLHFESKGDVLRLLKASKNRFGSIVNQAMFAMGDGGLELVDRGTSV